MQTSPGGSPSPDCQQVLATIVHEFQQKYDLLLMNDCLFLVGVSVV
jgi:hypothetical protein